MTIQLPNMPPHLSTNHLEDSRIANVKARGEVFVQDPCDAQTADFAHIGFGQLRASVALTTGVAPFGNHIFMVSGKCSQKEMGRIDARRIIATRTVVANAKTWGNRSMRQFPRNNVRPHVSPRTLEPAIREGLHDPRLPRPTRGRTAAAIHLRPKTGDVLRGILREHGEPPIRCAAPGAVISSASDSLCQLYHGEGINAAHPRLG